jgi:hypothetical protein
MAGLHVRYHEYTKLKKEKSSTRTLTCSLFGSMGFSCCCCASCSIAKAGERERERAKARIHEENSRCGRSLVWCVLPVACCREHGSDLLPSDDLPWRQPPFLSPSHTRHARGARSQLAAAAQRAD